MLIGLTTGGLCLAKSFKLQQLRQKVSSLLHTRTVWRTGVTEDVNSLFTYRTGESFQKINHCRVPFSSEVEDAVLNLVGEPALNQELADAYDGSLVCLVDGVCGGVSYALAALGNEQVIIETQVEVKAAIFPREEVKVENVVTIAEEEDTNKPIPTAPKTADSFWYPAWDKGSTEKVCLNDGEASQHANLSGMLVLPIIGLKCCHDI
jgi:hypothetical protein